VLVLGDGKHLFFGQAAQRDAVIECDRVRGRELFFACRRICNFVRAWHASTASLMLP